MDELAIQIAAEGILDNFFSGYNGAFGSAFVGAFQPWVVSEIGDLIRFMDIVGIDWRAIDSESMVRMAFAFSEFNIFKLDWAHGHIYFEGEDWEGNELAFSLAFGAGDSATDELYFSFSYPGGELTYELTAQNLLSSLLGVMIEDLPNPVMVTYATQFDYTIPNGAYKGLVNKVSLNYLLVNQDGQGNSHTYSLFFSEQSELHVPGGTVVSVGYRGRASLVGDPALMDSQTFETSLPEIMELLPDENSHFYIDSSNSTDVVVVGIGDVRDNYSSFLDKKGGDTIIASFPEQVTLRALQVTEYVDLHADLIDTSSQPLYKVIQSLPVSDRDWLEISETWSRATAVAIVDGEMRAYFLSTWDLVTWAAALRESEGLEATGLPPRFDWLNSGELIDFEADYLNFEPDADLDDKLIHLTYAYFIDFEEAIGYARSYHSPVFVHQSPSGSYFFGFISRENAAEIWDQWDQAMGLPQTMSLGSWTVEPEALVIPVIGEKDYPISVDSDHYRGARQFLELVDQLHTADEDEYESLVTSFMEGPHTRHFLLNELRRPDDLNQGAFLSIIQGMTGKDDFLDALATFVFEAVAGKCESIGLTMTENMAAFLEEILADDMIVKMFLLSYRQQKSSDQESIRNLFAEDEDDQQTIHSILMDLEKANNLIMGNEVDGITLDDIITRMEEVKTEIDEFIVDRKAMHAQGEGNLEAFFIMQEGEFGTTIRKEAYEFFGLALQADKFPHEDRVTDNFPSPLHAGTGGYSHLFEQLFVNQAVNLRHQLDVLNTIKTVALVASVFSIARLGGAAAVRGLGLAGAQAGGRMIAKKLVEAFVTATLAGFILEGINLAMGRGWDWERLGKTTAEAFILMLGFGAITSLIKIPILAFGANALLFIGYGIGRFRVSEGRWPNGWELNLIVLESILFVTLLHIGTKLTDPLYRSIMTQNKASTALVRVGAQGELAGIRAILESKIGELAAEAKKPEPDLGRARQIGEEFIQAVRDYVAWMKKYRGIELTESKADAEIAKAEDLIKLWEDAMFMEETQMASVDQTSDVIFYRSGSQSVDALKQRFGDDAVTEKRNGVVLLETPDGSFVLVPDEIPANAGPEGNAPEVFGDKIRLIDEGVYSYNPRYYGQIRTWFRSNGSWTRLTREVYLGVEEVPAGSGATRLVKRLFIAETKTNTLDRALELSRQKSGTGMEYLSLRMPPKAYRGIELMRIIELKGRAEWQQIEKLKEMEAEANARGETFAEYMANRFSNMTISEAEKVLLNSKSSKSSLKEIRKKAKVPVATLFPTLNNAQMVAIYRYTKNAIEINQDIRFGDPPELLHAAWRLVLNDALAQLPPVNDLVYRGLALTEAEVKTYYLDKIGQSFTEKGFYSTTQLAPTADYYMERNYAKHSDPTAVRVFIIAMSKTGVLIENLSYSGDNFSSIPPTQMEVLHGSPTTWQIDRVVPDVTTAGDKVYKVFLSEL